MTGCINSMHKSYRQLGRLLSLLYIYYYLLYIFMLDTNIGKLFQPSRAFNQSTFATVPIGHAFKWQKFFSRHTTICIC